MKSLTGIFKNSSCVAWCYCLIVSYWFWGVDWSQRIDTKQSGITGFLVSSQIGLLIRLVICTFLLLWGLKRSQRHIVVWLFVISSVILVTFNPDQVSLIGFCLAFLSIPILSLQKGTRPESIIRKGMILMLVLGFLIFLAVDLPSIFSGTYRIDYGLTTIHNLRYCGFFGGPIAASISNAWILTTLRGKEKGKVDRILKVLCWVGILGSQSVAGILYLLAERVIDYKAISFWKRVSVERMLSLMLGIVSAAVVIWIFYSRFPIQMDIFLAKMIRIVGVEPSAGMGFSSEAIIRSTGSADGRLEDITSFLGDMNGLDLIIGKLFSVMKGNSLSESGLVTLIYLFGVPLTIIYSVVTAKICGFRNTAIFFVLNIPYNLMLIFPVCWFIMSSSKKDMSTALVNGRTDK